MGDIHGFSFVHPTARVLDPHLSIFLNERAIRLDAYCRLDGLIKIEGGKGVTIGKHVHIASFSHINAGGGEVVFGDHSGCASHVVICGGMPDLAFYHISAADLAEHRHPLRKVTVIGQHVVIFSHAVICPGITIGDGAVIGAGAVVTRDVPQGEFWGGVPARKISRRNELVGANGNMQDVVLA